MPISLKDFNKTEFQGLYISKKTFGDKGNKYIGRFQVNHKKYMKVLGYSHINHMNNFKAYEILNEYQDNISHSTKQTSHYHLIPQSDAYIVIDDNELVIDDLIEDYKRMKDIVNDFFPLVNNSEEFIENMQSIYQVELLKQYEIEFTKVETFLINSNKKIIISIYSEDESLVSSIIKSIK
jgi:tRNA threonylcarbamoyladenosine modification (KEOPS) complex  Pcc1 subunit